MAKRLGAIRRWLNEPAKDHWAAPGLPVPPPRPKPQCPKCAGAKTRLRYRAGRRSGCRADCPTGEHLHRTCESCGYWWVMPCLDAPEA